LVSKAGCAWLKNANSIREHNKIFFIVFIFFLVKLQIKKKQCNYCEVILLGYKVRVLTFVPWPKQST
jgi:hypothetical protein